MAYVPLSSSGPATGSAPGYVPLGVKSPLPPVASPAAGYQPISTVGLLAPKSSMVPVSTPAAAGSTPSEIPTSALKGSLGGGYGASNITDQYSGKPLLTYENPAAKSSQLLSDRTAPTFDPTVPQKIDSSVLKNGRMPESVSQAIKAKFPGSAAYELDHIMPLELGGSNDTSNQRLEPGKNPSQPYSPSKNPTATDPIENQLKADAVNGKISVVDAWRQMAKIKGITLEEDQTPAAHAGKISLPITAPANEGSTAPKAPNAGGTSAVQNTIENLITSNPLFQMIAKVAGGTSIITAIKDTYSGGGRELTADDINTIMLQRQKLIESGTPASQATKLAANQVKQGKLKAQILGSVVPEGDLEAEGAKAVEEAATAGEKAVADEAKIKGPDENLPSVAIDKQAQDEAAAKTIASNKGGVSGLDKETGQAYRDWVNRGGNSNQAISGKIASNQFEDLRKGGMDLVHEYQTGDPNNVIPEAQKSSISTFTDNLLKKEQAAGIPVAEKANYIPQYWANSEAEIQKAYAEYSGGKSLSLSPGFSKESLFPDYATGEKYGLTPKYTNLADIMNARVRASERAISDRNFYDFLTSRNLVQPSSKVGAGWEQLDPKFPADTIKLSDGTTYRGTVSAPQPLADLINNQLRGPQGIFEKGLQATANFATKLKNVVLSAGVPGTAINLHGFNELAATVPEAVNQPSLFTSALQYMLYPKAGGKFVADNLELAQQAARDGLTITAEDHAFDKLGTQKIASGAIGKIGAVLQKASDGLYSFFGKHDFEEMIPALKLKMYSDLKDTLLEQGQSEADAGRMAAEKANNTFGGVNYAALGRDKNLQNFLRATVFAPDFWESRLRYAGSLGKSLVSSKDPLASTYRTAVATIIGSYVGMNLWNHQNSGKWMFQNPAGHQMDIWMGNDSQGKDIWLRPFGTDLDFVRLPLDIAKSVTEGNASPVSALFRNRVSTILQPVISAVANVDANGNPIFGPTSQTNPISKQLGTFASTLPVVPQVIAGLSTLGQPNKSTFQSLSQAVSLPVRFNAPANSSSVSNLATMIYTDRPKLETQIKKYYLAGNEQAALDTMSTYNKNLLQAAIQSYRDNGHNITDEKVFTDWLVNTTRAHGGLKDVFLKPPGQKAMSNAQATQGKPLFNKIFPSTTQ